MKATDQKHTVITENVKRKIEPLKVVFPSLYGKLYAEAAHELNMDLNPDELLDPEMLNEQVVRHVMMLSSCAEQAVDAIEREDKQMLASVLAETKALRDEINSLQKIVYEDALTKSYNRKWFEDNFLDTDKHRMRSAGTMVVVDLNKFKHINDTYGHIIGDKVLIHLTKKLQESGADVIRFGGDEFMMIFDAKVSSNDIQHKLDAILHTYDKTSFKVESGSFKVSFAYGITPFKEGYELSAIIDVADKAMYRHKRTMK